jgi:hypothetical protein
MLPKDFGIGLFKIRIQNGICQDKTLEETGESTDHNGRQFE